MRPIFVLLLVSILSILAVKYANNSLGDDVPLATPATAANL